MAKTCRRPLLAKNGMKLSNFFEARQSNGKKGRTLSNQTRKRTKTDCQHLTDAWDHQEKDRKQRSSELEQDGRRAQNFSKICSKQNAMQFLIEHMSEK
ncbi:hypothetical protein OESDEN_14768 [Oesophagostomum dentatum]|uniref:Uncharacterized protein n=1 Tax=Oesophagostomum dentatum TaxID=61180 RepID=A0A0B1SKQ5_OESDE|nr:hypothetical protein OESDEN_14768 [Oesophagostomum dentatum]